MTAHTRLDPPLVESIRKALTRNALPGETNGLGKDDERQAAEFIADVAVFAGKVHAHEEQLRFTVAELRRVDDVASVT